MKSNMNGSSFANGNGPNSPSVDLGHCEHRAGCACRWCVIGVTHPQV